jgi:hypothetical protein
MRLIVSIVVGLGLSTSISAGAQPAAQARDLGLRIVVIEGEGAVNIIQQKTAVAPIVEVRDRNNLPVPGAVVTFSVTGGKSATFGGAQTLTLTTNAAGRAAAASFSPLGSGSVQIQVSAAFQGQTAAATIAQTNVMTAAQAAGAAGATSGSGAGGGSSGASSGAAGGSGGGLSGTTIGIIGAAVGGGALAATTLKGDGDDEPPRTTFTGSFSAQVIVVTTSGNNTCTSTRALTGTLTIHVGQNPDGTVTGTGSTSGTQTEVERTAFCSNLPTVPFNWGGDLSGSASSFGYTHRTSVTGDISTSTNEFIFTASLSGGVVSGTISFTQTQSGQGTGGNVISGRGTTTFAVTLRQGG